MLDTEDLGEDLGHGVLDRGGGQPTVRRVLEVLGLGQRAGVELAHRRQRNLVDHHDRRRHHVRRHEGRGVRGQDVRIERRAGCRRDVGDEDGVARRRGPADRRGERDVVPSGEDGVDLTEFDAEAAHLDLGVGAADVRRLQTVGSLDPPHDVTGAVHPRAGRRRRIGDEARRRQSAARVVAAGHAGADQIQISRDTHRDGPQPLVEHECGDAVDGAADDHRAVRGQPGDIGDDGGLGGAVAVEQVTAGRPGRDDVAGDGLAAGDHPLEVLETRRIERGQDGRCEERVRDAVPKEELPQLFSAVDVRRGDRHRRARAEHEQQLEDRRVEARGGEVQHAGRRRHLVPFALEHRESGQTRVGHHDALGQTGGARGVDDVGGRVHTDGSEAVRRGQRSGRGGDDVRRIVLSPGRSRAEHDPLDAVDVRQVGQSIGGGQTEVGLGVGEHVLDAVRGVVRVDRNERAAGPRDGPLGEQGLDGAPDGHRHPDFRADAARDQRAGQAGGPGVEFGVGDFLHGTVGGRRHHGDTVRVAPDGLVHQIDETRARHGRIRGRRRAERVELRHLGGIEDREITDGRGLLGASGRPGGVAVVGGDDAAQHGGQPPLHRVDRGGVEDVGGVAEVSADAGRSALGVDALGELEREVELGELDVDRTRRDRQAG